MMHPTTVHGGDQIIGGASNSTVYARQRQPSQQQQQQPSIPYGHQRIGGVTPYRDDPHHSVLPIVPATTTTSRPQYYADNTTTTTPTTTAATTSNNNNNNNNNKTTTTSSIPLGYDDTKQKPRSFTTTTASSTGKRVLQSTMVCVQQSCCRHLYSATTTTTAVSGNNNNNKNDNNDDDDDYYYYRDDFNDLSWSCTMGTQDEHGIWLNRHDPAGTMMAMVVWFLIGYSAMTMTFLAQTGGIPTLWAELYAVLAALALAAHAKTSITDPGAVPASAVPTEQQRRHVQNNNNNNSNSNSNSNCKLSMCSQCQTFKPPQSHHCRICNRCISRMDHHCPWMNNCIGAGNMKHFILFLIYTWSCSTLCLLLLGWNYFFCATDDCIFTVVLVQLVRIMTCLSVAAFLFTSSMLMNVCYGLMTGIGTIDRLKKKAQNIMDESDEEQVPLRDVFGIGPYWTWMLPIDPVLQDHDRIMGYSTPQRLLREQLKRRREQPDGFGSGGGGGSGDHHHHGAGILPVTGIIGTSTGFVEDGDAPSFVSRDSYGIPLY